MSGCWLGTPMCHTARRTAPIWPSYSLANRLLPPAVESLPSTKSAVFLDKDGTLVRDTPYSADADALRLLPEVATGLRILMQAGFALVVVTNQSGVARGLVSPQSVEAVGGRLADLFADAGAVLSGFYYCPHHSDGVVAAYAH